MPIFAFKGEAYSGFDAPSLTPNELDITQSRPPNTLWPLWYFAPANTHHSLPFRDGNQTFNFKKEGSLYNFWRPKLTDYINQQLADKKCNLILLKPRFR